MDRIHQALTSAYSEVLSELPLHWLDRSRAHEPEFAKLSGLFLPGTSPSYEQAPRRIMVVGRETRRWNVVSSQAPFLDLEDYIQRAMAKQQAHLAPEIFPSVKNNTTDFRYDLIKRTYPNDQSPQAKTPPK